MINHLHTASSISSAARRVPEPQPQKKCMTGICLVAYTCLGRRPLDMELWGNIIFCICASFLFSVILIW